MTTRPGASAFAELHDDLRSVAAAILAGRPRPDDLWRRASDAGWLGLEVPDSLGGSGATFAETAVVLEEIGRATGSVPILGTVLGVGAVSSTQASPSRDRLLADVASGHVRVAAAIATHPDDVDAGAPFTLSGDGVFSGRAELVVDAPGADRLLLCAERPGRGPVLIVVSPEQVRVTERPVLDATRSVADVEASGVVVDPDAVWSFVVDDAVERLFNRAAVAVAVDAIGVASMALAATVDYVGVRHQFGRAVGSFQAVKHRCADMAVAIRVGGSLLDRAIHAIVSDESHADTALAVSRAKSYVTGAAVDVVGGAMQLHGGIGYTWESGLHVWMKRATFDRALYGSPAAHRRRIARVFTRP